MTRARLLIEEIDFAAECLQYNAIEGCMHSADDIVAYCNEAATPSADSDFTPLQRSLFTAWAQDATLVEALRLASLHWEHMGTPRALRYKATAEHRMGVVAARVLA